MSAETLRKKPACVLRRDAWLTELRQLEDRESLRPWLQKYGCFEKKNGWSSSGMIHLDNLKELAKKFRLHKSIPNFFRDYTTEDSLVAVLKRYVRNNAAFLSLAPSSVARARRSGGGHAHTDPAAGASGAGGVGGGGGDAPQTTSVLLNPNNGGRKLFGYSDADLTTGMIQMSRMGLNSRAVDRLQIICNHNKRLSASAGARHSASGECPQRGGSGGVSGSGGAAGGGEDRHGLASGLVMKLVRDGVVVALMKLIHVESVPAHRLVSGCLVNLTTSRDVTWELIQAKGHQVLAFLVNGAKTRDPTTLSNVAIALCRCTYEARNHESLVTEFNTAQALCYIMQRQTANLKIAGAKGMLNMCGLSSSLPALAAKLDVSGALANPPLHRSLQTFVCRGIQGLTSVPACLSRVPDSGIVDLLLPLVKLNLKRPENLAYLTSASVNLADLKSSHAQLVKQKDIVTVLCLLSSHPKLVESCCVAAACLSRTRDLETHLAPLATTLVEINLPNEASVDCVAFFLQNVSRAHPVSESSVTSWLALEADSASPDGRLACLSAIEHLIRNQEDVDTPLLQAGLMGTLHAILDEPVAAKATEQAKEAALQGQTEDPFISVADGTATATPGSAAVATASTVPGATTPLGSPSGTAASGRKAGERPSSPNGAGGLLNVKKIVAISQHKKKNREHLMRSSPDILDRILALTTDESIKFMAAACIFSLAQSAELCPDIAESGAADLALEDLATGGRPGQAGQEESEFLLAQLAVVAQVAVEPRFCRRLASPETIDLLVVLALGTAPKDRRGHRGSEEAKDFEGGTGGKTKGSGRGSGDDHVGGSGGGGGVEPQGTAAPKLPQQVKRFSGEKVKVATPYVGALRYCVVTIVERLGGILDDGGEFERTSSTPDTTSMVEKLVYLVCSVVLTSGRDEALMCRCARNYVSVALCNVAAASYCEMQLLSASEDESAATAATTGVADKAVAKAGEATKGTNQRQIDGRSSSSSILSYKNDESDHNHQTSESDTTTTQERTSSLPVDDGPSTAGGANGGDQYWLMTTDILRDIVDSCLASATADVKSNLIKAMNNLMVSDERRAALVEGKEMSSLFELVHGYTPEVRELVARMLWNLTCERGFHSALLEADVTYTLLELLGSSFMQSTKKISNQTTSTTMGRGGGSATTTSLMGSTPSSGAINVHDGAGGTVGGEHSTAPGEKGDTGEHAQDMSNGAGSTTSAGAGVGSGLDTGGAVGGGASCGSSGGPSTDGGGQVVEESNNTESGAHSASPEVAGTGHAPTLEVRRNVLGAVMNLTSFSISDPRLDPKAVMSLLALVIREDPNESLNEDTAADLWVTWQAVVLQLSFVEKYRPLIVYHGDGQVFSYLKMTNDPLSGKSSVMSMAHDRAYKRLIMGTMVNISCEPSLYEELEGQVQVLREFLSEYEHEASGGGHTTGGTLIGSRGAGGMGLGDSGGDGIDADDRGMDDDNVGGAEIGGGGGGTSGESSSRGRDWVRHELCGKLVSNLFSSKTLRERLSKKPVAGILVGLLCGPPVRLNNGTTHSAGSGSTNTTPGSATRSNKSGGDNTPSGKRAISASSEKRGHSSRHHSRRGSKQEGKPPQLRTPLPEGCAEPRPMLYGGGDEAAAIASRFVCEMSILYAAEGGFELPQRTFDALVKIAHYYNYNASATLATAASNPWKTTRRGERGLGGGRGGGGGLEDKPSGKESTTTPLVGGRPTPRTMDNNSHVGQSGANDEDVAVVPDRGNAPSDRAIERAGSTESTTDTTATVVAATASPHRIETLEELHQQPVGDDWYTVGGGQPSSLVQQSGDDVGSSARQHGGEGCDEDAWSKTAREITRLWVRAVGSLCCPSHSELWPQLLDVGILGALNTCLSSSALSGDDDGPAICSAALRNLSTATSPRALTGERAAACFGAAERLLSCCDQPQVKIDCAAAIVNFVDATQVQDLQTIKRLEDSARALVNPPLPHRGPWKFLHPNENLGATALPIVNKRTSDERTRDSAKELSEGEQPRWLGDAALATARGQREGGVGVAAGTGCPALSAGSLRWELELAVRKKEESEAISLFDDDEGLGPKQLSGMMSSQTMHDITDDHHTPQRGDTASAAAAASAGSEAGGEETKSGKAKGGGGGKTTGGGGASLEKEPAALLSAPDGGDTGAGAGTEGDGNGPKSGSGKRNLRQTAARLAVKISEASMAARAFGSKSTGPVNLESRILRNPILAKEEPPFEVPWLLKHGKAERLRLLEESLVGVAQKDRWPDSKFSSPKDGVRSSGVGKGCQTKAAASEQQRQGIDNNGGVKMPGGQTAESASDGDIFEVLTVPDDKWISPDLPPEAGKQQDHAAASGGSRVGSGRPGAGARVTTVGRPTGVSLTPQQLVGLHKVSQRRVI
eukprot:g17841.t1